MMSTPDTRAPRHRYLGEDGRIHEGVSCNADRLYRCRACKPPLAQLHAEARTLDRLRLGLILATGFVGVLLAGWL